MASSNAEKVMATMNGHAARYVNPDRFIQHDPTVADGVARSGGLDVVRVVEDGDCVVVHGRDEADGKVVFTVFRLEDGLIAEQWLFSEAIAAPNKSGHTQTDGPTEPDDGQDTGKVKALVREYYETVHIGGRHDLIDRYMPPELQIRHEPGVRDGVSAFKQDVAVLTRDRTIDEIRLLLGQGDLVFIAALGTHGGDPCAYIDLYRVEEDKLVEHWGFFQPIAPPDTRKNRNQVL